MNNIIELSDTAKPSSSEHVNNYRLNQIDKIKDCFNNEINERKDIIKKLNKYIVSFDYLGKIFITLSASFGMLSIASHATIVGIPVGISIKGISIVNAFDKIIKQSNKKPNKIWVDQGSEFYNNYKIIYNFIIKNGYQTIIYKCIQLIMKVNQ